MRVRHLSLLVVVILVALCVRSIRRAEDFGGYVAVGEVVLAGGEPYLETTPGMNTWPPVFGLVCVPWALLDRVDTYLARGVWLALVLLGLLASLHLLARRIHGKPLTLGSEGVPLSSLAVVVPLLLASSGVIGNFIHLQINTIIFALVLWALLLDEEDRWRAAGVLIGVAAAVRVMPILFVPYLLWRGRWKTAGTATVVAGVLSVAPTLVFGWDGFASQVQQWYEITSSSTTWGVGHMNQSMPAMWDRYVGHGVVPFVTEPVHALPGSGSALARALGLLTLAALAALALWRFRGPLRPGSRAVLAEWSIVFLVGAACGPVAWKAYLVVLLLPFMLLWALRAAPETPAGLRKGCTILLVLGGVFLTLPTRDLLGRRIASHLEMGSAFAIGALVLLAGLFWLHARLSRLAGERR